MIFNRRLNMRENIIFIGVCFVVLAAGLGLFNRYQIHQRITRPLEIRAEIQAKALEQAADLTLDYYDGISQLSERESLYPEVDSAVLSSEGILWSEFQDSNRLQLILRDLDLNEELTLESAVSLSGYSIRAPFVFDDQIHVLIKYYPRNLFQQELRSAYLRLTLFIMFLILVTIVIFRLNRNFVAQPLSAIRQGIEQIRDNKYTFEYISNNGREIDELGAAVATLTSELKANREELKSSEKRLTLLLDHLNLGVILINPSGKIELVNPEAKELLNIDNKALNQSYQAVIRSYTLIEMINKVLQTHHPANDEIEIYIPSSRYIDVNIIPYGPAKENVVSILVLLYDITEIRRLETVRSEFVANASHELRTPVTAIKGFAETLLDGALDNPEIANKFITIIANESNRLEVIIDDILELSRVEKQSEPLSIQTFDIVEIANDLVEFFYNNAHEKEINIKVEAEGPIMIYADQHRVEQIFINLIDNAINYSTIASEIKISIEQDQELVNFSVSDNGIGIPEEDQKRIFERFYRVDKGRSRNSGGTGLGLSIVRNLVKIMNGTISVDSIVGEGTTFYVSLPLN